MVCLEMKNIKFLTIFPQKVKSEILILKQTVTSYSLFEKSMKGDGNYAG